MKELFGYLTWTWRKWEIWQRLFVIAMLLQTLGWFLPGLWGIWISGIGFGIVMFFLFKWFMFEPIKENWAKYKQHRNSLLTTIKTSDERQRKV